jgi:hypothetical protein
MKYVMSQKKQQRVQNRNSDRNLFLHVFARKGFLFSSLKFMLLVLLLLSLDISPSNAQGAYFWSEQERIPEYLDSTEEPPYLIADMNHVVHAFNSQPLDLAEPASPSVVFYRQWTLESGWTSPNDILIDPDGYNLNVLGVTSDRNGHVHLLILKNGDIYYTQNYLANAGNSVSWPVPVLIANSISSFGPGNEIVSAIATSSDGNEIVVIYAGRQEGNGLYYTQSTDGGNSWSEPYPIYLTGDPTITVTDPKLIAGESGLYHAVWTTFLEDGSAGPGYYASFDPKTSTWSEPMELDVPGMRTPSVIETQGDIFISYYHQNVNGNWWRKSSDGGKTWSLPEQISPQHLGTNGAVSFAVDSKNVLHAFFGERINDLNHGIWHVIFNGTTWSDLEAVVRAPQRRERIGGNGFDPRSARAVILNGNVALVTWGTDGFAGTNGAWYSYKRLDAPELPSVVLDSPTQIPQIESTSTAELPLLTADLTPTASANPNIFKDPPGLNQDPQISILIGVIPVLLLLAGMIVMYFILSRKQ